MPRLDEPTPGQEYFKLPLDGSLSALLAQQTQLTREFDAELCGFFEGWLHRRYRRGDDENELSHLLSFPVVHLPKGELAGVLRARVKLRFGSGQSKAFVAPTRAERQRGGFPSAPDQARLTRVTEAEGAWPFFIDTKLLHRTFGVPVEGIDALFESLRKLPTVSETQLLARLTAMLEAVLTRANDEPLQLEADATEGPSDFDGWLKRLSG
ncbi:MAG TPA: hypothetical protein VEQ59_03035, partial [Polyangiaceae bacterium]|nr:hypothetical protein [Polyangiaceae bacterium]